MQKSIMGDVSGIRSQEQWGHMLAWFKWTYALASPFAGYVADRFGRRHVIALSLLVDRIGTKTTGIINTPNCEFCKR
mgnify:CR=1 FL=1